MCPTQRSANLFERRFSKLEEVLSLNSKFFVGAQPVKFRDFARIQPAIRRSYDGHQRGCGIGCRRGAVDGDLLKSWNPAAGSKAGTSRPVYPRASRSRLADRLRPAPGSACVPPRADAPHGLEPPPGHRKYSCTCRMGVRAERVFLLSHGMSSDALAVLKPPAPRCWQARTVRPAGRPESPQSESASTRA
jgi:hypothetical protein